MNAELILTADDLDLALESLNETDGSLLSQMTDVSDYRPAPTPVEDAPFTITLWS